MSLGVLIYQGYDHYMIIKSLIIQNNAGPTNPS